MSEVETEILARVEGAVGHIVLNRPGALNALTLNMVRLIDQALTQFAQDERVRRVVVTGAGTKAFCAGGDIRWLYEQGKAGEFTRQRQFWQEEYILNARIKHFPKPFISLIDGICMGGGVGVSQHGTLRVISETYLFAMPEVAIGFVPDIGSSYFLPRLRDHFGIYAGVVGARVRAGDAIAFGLADYFVASEKMPELLARLISGQAIEAVIADLASAPPAGELAGRWAEVRACFEPAGGRQILARLEAVANNGSALANELLTELRKKSPFAVAVTAEELRRGAELAKAGQGLEAALQVEYRLVSRIVEEPDFYEGIRAVIVDRDQSPRWRHARIEDVPQAEVEAMFAALPGHELIEG